MGRILRLMDAGTRSQPEHALAGRITASEIDLAYINRSARVKRFNFFFSEGTRLIEMVDLLALDLTEKVDLRVEMEGSGRPWRTDEDGRFQGYYIVAIAVLAEVSSNLAEKLAEEFTEAVVMLLEYDPVVSSCGLSSGHGTE